MTEAPPRHRSRLRAFLQSLALLGGALLVGAGLAEVAVRVVAPQQLIRIRPDVWQPADTLGWIFRPNVRTEMNTGEGPVHVLTDAQGYRIGQGRRPDGDPTIFLMGDSFMAALQVEYEQSVAGLLEHALAAAPGRAATVRNAAVAGWDPPQYYYRTRAALATDVPDVILVAVYLGNDVVDRPLQPLSPLQAVRRKNFHWPETWSVGGIVDAVVRPVNDVLEERSHAFIMAKNAAKTVLMAVGLTPEYFPDEFYRREASSPRWAQTADILAKLAGEAGVAGVPVVFALIPTPYQVDADIFRQYVHAFDIDSTAVDLDQPSRRLSEELRTRGLDALDLLPAFREAHRAGEQLYGTVDRHFTAAGHRLMTTLVTAPLEAAMASRQDANHD